MNFNQEQGFNTIAVGILPLVAKLKENMTVHVKTHDEACNAFRETAYAKLIERADKVKKGTTVNMNFNMAAPVSHEEEYVDVIGMLEFALATAGEVYGVNPTIQLDKEQYRNFIQDKWNWTQTWGTAISGYCGLK